MLSQQTKTQIAMSNTEYGKFQGAAKDGQGMSKQTSANPSNEHLQGQEQPARVDEVYNELIHMRKMNRVLGQRIKQLEV